MKLLILSDLHIEFEDYKIEQNTADVVILAGDIHIGLKGVNWIKDNIRNKPVVYILGNHEYYTKKYPGLIKAAQEKVNGTNIHLLENNYVVFDNICIHGATLWTDFSILGNTVAAGFECQESVTDFKKIRIEPAYSKIRYTDIQLIHQRSLRVLKENIKKNKDKINILLSHHAPSIKSIPEQFRKDIFSAAYASNLESFIEENNIKFWIHGHLHSSSDYYLDECRVICNPRGYPDERNKEFKSELIIEI